MIKNNREIGFLVVICLLVGVGSSSGQTERHSERYINLNMSEGDIRDALKLVAEHGGLNLVVGPEVQGKVSLYLTNATLESALRAITLNNGFEYSVDSGIISVSKKVVVEKDVDEVPPLETRIFTLRSADAVRVRDALRFALSPHGKMEVFNENSNAGYNTLTLGQLEGDVGGTGNVNNGAALQNNANQQGQNGLQTSTATPAQNARKLVVTDVVENLPAIEDLVSALDKMPPQVLIESRLVEISTDLQRQLGIDWDINVLANGPILNHELPLHMEAGFASGNQIRRTASGSANSSVGLSLGTIDFSQLTAFLRIHQTDNSLRLLANPRLLVFNNHHASILVGERYPLLESNVSEFGVVTESLQTYIPVGVQLEVCPTIMVDGRVTMMIHPVTSALGDDVVGTTGIRVARIQTRELSTRVIMEDGQTIVLGGLISDRKARSINKIPGLGDIFGLSALFRQENPSSQRTDLLVFVTAKVEGGQMLSSRDREIFDSYEPNFKEIPKLQDVPLHFEDPTEYQSPRPMFGDPQGRTTTSKDWHRDDAPPSDSIDVIRKDPLPASRPSNRRGRIAASEVQESYQRRPAGNPLEDEEAIRQIQLQRYHENIRQSQAATRRIDND